MAECATCRRVLNGSWDMTLYDATYNKAGRYLGITDGYFLGGNYPNWVFCYCKPCWEKAILALPFISNARDIDILQQQINVYQQNESNLQRQLGALQRNQTNLQQQIKDYKQNENNLQQQLRDYQQNEKNLQQQLSACEKKKAKWQRQVFSTKNELNCHKHQLEEMREKYDKLSNIRDIEKLRNLLKQLTASQIDTLHSHTQFRVDTIETAYVEQQLQYVQSAFTQLKASVDAVIQLRQNKLEDSKKAREDVFKTLTTADIPKTTIDASIKPLDTDIAQIEAGIEGWNIFSTALNNTVNEPIVDQDIVIYQVIETVTEAIE